jgi:hypothetical protein
MEKSDLARQLAKEFEEEHPIAAMRIAAWAGWEVEELFKWVLEHE